MKLNKFKKRVELLGLDYKKELLKFVIIDSIGLVALILISIMLKLLYVSLLFVGVLGVINFVLFNSYSNREKQLKIDRDNEFITLIKYFEIYLSNGFNIYQSFSHIVPLCTNWMKEKIEEFLNSVDEDKSVKPFIDFADNFHNSNSKNIMLSIYQMVDSSSKSDQLMYFDHLFQEMNRNHLTNLKDKKDKTLSNFSVFPLIGAGLIIMILCFSVIFVMGDLINVI